jgi:hypothetical protein
VLINKPKVVQNTNNINVLTSSGAGRSNFNSTPTNQNVLLNSAEKQDDYLSTKISDSNHVINNVLNNLGGKNEEGVKKSSTISGSNANAVKNAKVNLWRRPSVCNPSNQEKPVNEGSNLKNSIRISQQKKGSVTSNKSNKANNSSNFYQLTTNQLSTNYTETNNTISRYNAKDPTNFIETPKNIDNINFHNELNYQDSKGNHIFNNFNNYYTNYNTNINMYTEGNTSQEVMKDISNLKNFVKKYFGSENGLLLSGNYNDEEKMKGLNQMLKDIENEKEIETHTNVINAEMLNGDFSPMKMKSSFTPMNLEREEKDKIISNSNKRMKKYETLLGSIANSIKEIQDLLYHSNLEDETLVRIEEVNSNKLSSLHSKINLNSKTSHFIADNLTYKGEAIYDYEDSEMQENVQVHITKNNQHLEDGNKEMFLNSVFVSSIGDDYYQNILEESFNTGILEISNDMSSIKTNNEHIRRLERMISNGSSSFSDRSPLMFLKSSIMNKNLIESNIFNRNIIPPILTTSNPLVQRAKEEECILYNEGEENLEESDPDKTQENIQISVQKSTHFNQMLNSMDKVKFFVNIFYNKIFSLQITLPKPK